MNTSPQKPLPSLLTTDMKTISLLGSTPATPIFPRGHSDLPFEKARKRGLYIKTKKIADLLDGVVIT